jgi:kinesin family member C2/C3
LCLVLRRKLSFSGDLGGHAKTLMFVQVNPDASSYSETLSTLKFAERVSSVELGAAKSNKEGKELRDLIELVSFLKLFFF